LAALLETRLDQAGSGVLNALKLLALCEPLDIDALTELAGDDVAHQRMGESCVEYRTVALEPDKAAGLRLVDDVVPGQLGER
ncbi:hypothetical protein C6A85_10320, partial [Mycobacterium sp. ITM-2017-0098]